MPANRKKTRLRKIAAVAAVAKDRQFENLLRRAALIFAHAKRSTTKTAASRAR